VGRAATVVQELVAGSYASTALLMLSLLLSKPPRA
jgi:hypothetical protein